MKYILCLLVVAYLAVVQVQAYSYASSCNPYQQPCYTFTCGTNTFRVPVGLHYGCCTNQIFDHRSYICARVNGIVRVLGCHPGNQFRCQNGHCTHHSWKCDGANDCRDGSDEVGCSSCSTAQFRCRNGRCIPKSYVCDKDNDCGDGSDEVACSRVNGGWCGSGQYRCDNDRCIPRNWVCDRDNDCGDRSDETGCRGVYTKRDPAVKKDAAMLDEPEVKKPGSRNDMSSDNDKAFDATSAKAKEKAKKFPDKKTGMASNATSKYSKCSHNQYRCRNGRCIDQRFTCDTDNDCGDGSDEVGCGSCSSGQYRCANGRCINRAFVCDNDNDCGDGSDQRGCGSCNIQEYRCVNNGRCITKSWVCDKDNDCKDGSDENGCGSCHYTKYRCDNDRCIDRNYVCDHDNDCGDHSDETGCPSKKRDPAVKKDAALLDKPKVKKLGSSNDATSAKAKERAKKYPEKKTGEVDREEEDKEPAIDRKQ